MKAEVLKLLTKLDREFKLELFKVPKVPLVSLPLTLGQTLNNPRHTRAPVRPDPRQPTSHTCSSF